MSVLDQYQTIHDSAMPLAALYGVRRFAQTFQAGLSGDLDTVKLWMRRKFSPNNLIVEIRTVAGEDPTSTILASQEIISTNISTDSAGAEVIVNFSSPATLISGTTYAIVIKQKNDGGNATDYYYWKGNTSPDLYVNGRSTQSEDSGSTWEDSPFYEDHDYYFKTYIETTEVISDINNDFRFVKNFAYANLDNDFRMVSTLTQIDISNDFRLTGAAVDDILNDFRFIESNIIVSDINNDFRMIETPPIIEVVSDIFNLFNFVNSIVSDINNDIRTHKIETNNISNDFRLIADWQIPGDAGFQSLGKTYIKVFIDSVEQADADIDSVSINKILNGTHTATFDLGRAYDNTKPNMEAMVEIKYKDWVLYKGYIIDVLPTDSPESIRISCNDKYWKQNKTNKYFHVGHKPQDDKELYYNTIKEGLSNECDFNVDIGNFIPQTMNLFGEGESDCISSLIQQAGNFGWFYKEDETKKLWVAGQGDIINIERQSIGANIGLYQIIKHQFSETVEGLVNKFRVQMGEKIIRTFNDDGGVKSYSGYKLSSYRDFAQPAWDYNFENTYGSINDTVGKNDIYVKYRLPRLDPKLESWSDRYPPRIELYHPSGRAYTSYGYASIGLTEGFSIDYENGLLILNEPIFAYSLDSYGSVIAVRRPIIKLYLFKKLFYSWTASPSEDPEADASNPMMFFTDKMGDYPETIIKNLDLSTLSIQEGIVYEDAEGNEIVIPSWDDTDFAKDYANWQLSKTADEKVSGSINITLDTFLFYGIDLSKRIMINGVIDNPLNITSITINTNTFIVTLNLETIRNYERTVNLQSRGE